MTRECYAEMVPGRDRRAVHRRRRQERRRAWHIGRARVGIFLDRIDEDDHHPVQLAKNERNGDIRLFFLIEKTSLTAVLPIGT